MYIVVHNVGYKYLFKCCIFFHLFNVYTNRANAEIARDNAVKY